MTGQGEGKGGEVTLADGRSADNGEAGVHRGARAGRESRLHILYVEAQQYFERSVTTATCTGLAIRFRRIQGSAELNAPDIGCSGSFAALNSRNARLLKYFNPGRKK